MANWANGSPSASGKQKMQRKKWNLDGEYIILMFLIL